MHHSQNSITSDSISRFMCTYGRCLVETFKGDLVVTMLHMYIWDLFYCKDCFLHCTSVNMVDPLHLGPTMKQQIILIGLLVAITMGAFGTWDWTKLDETGLDRQE